jgi:hypothetical protein
LVSCQCPRWAFEYSGSSLRLDRDRNDLLPRAAPFKPFIKPCRPSKPTLCRLSESFLRGPQPRLRSFPRIQDRHWMGSVIPATSPLKKGPAPLRRRPCWRPHQGLLLLRLGKPGTKKAPGEADDCRRLLHRSVDVESPTPVPQNTMDISSSVRDHYAMAR